MNITLSELADWLFWMPMQSQSPPCRQMTFLRVESAPAGESTPRLRETLSRLLTIPGDVVIDLRGAPIDTAGLSSVLGMQHHLARLGRRLLVIADDPSFLELADRVGARQSLTLFTNAEEAVQYSARAGEILAA